MEAFTYNQWAVVLLVFVLGLLIGIFLLAGGKWKRRYREESVRREELERENAQLRRDVDEFGSLRHAAGKTPIRPATERGPL